MDPIRTVGTFAVVTSTLAFPAFAAAGPASGPIPAPITVAATADQCMAPAAFLDTLAIAGDWVIGRSPQGSGPNVKGVVFRESGLIDVAVFEGGCLAAIFAVAKAPPDLRV